MDNLFQLIIFLVIIYSIFNVIFGKKKPQSTNTKTPENSTGEGQAKPSPASSPTDLLEEMFGFKIPKTDNEYQAPKQNSRSLRIPPSIEVSVPEVKTQENSDPVLMNENQTNLGGPEHVKNILTSTSERTIEIKNEIKRPASLRKLYLISEILNKPKVFRK